MPGTPITEEVAAQMRYMRSLDWRYEEISELFECDPKTVMNHAKDGRKLPARKKPRNYSDHPKAVAARERRQNPEKAERDRAASRAWKERNRKKVRAYDSERRANKRHKANGSPPPTNGRSCKCPSPLGEAGEPCGWCSDTIPDA